MPRLLRSVLAGALAALVCASDPAAAAGKRSFVSSSGVDNPTCSVASACRSFFGAAVAATTAGGEVIALELRRLRPGDNRHAVGVDHRAAGRLRRHQRVVGQRRRYRDGSGRLGDAARAHDQQRRRRQHRHQFHERRARPGRGRQRERFLRRCLLAAPASTGDLVRRAARASAVAAGGSSLRGAAVRRSRFVDGAHRPRQLASQRQYGHPGGGPCPRRDPELVGDLQHFGISSAISVRQSSFRRGRRSL